MGRKYIDFWVELREENIIKELMSRALQLGYRSIVVSYSDESLYEKAREIGERINLEIYRKIILEPQDRSSLLKELRKCRGSYEVVTVICRNLEVALVAVRDGRIDSIIIPPDKNYRIDKGVASTIKNAVEIPFKWILDEKSRRMFLKTVSEIILHLSRRTNIIVSSSASKPMELRGPYEMSSLLQIYSIDKKTALDAVSEIPSKIIEENLIKLSPNYIARGVVKIG
ncbi:MAG: RNase P subunit p30 family protein [Nitrososphaerota archaeon]|nr:hypothetical protein [Candidatus Geocrenenecus dongiae]